MANKKAGDTASKIVIKGKTLSIRTKVDFGEEGLPLNQLPKLHKKLRARGSELLNAIQQMKASRNDSCPCGSGKKFKRCCGADRSGAPGDRGAVASPGMSRASQGLRHREHSPPGQQHEVSGN